MDDGTPRQLMFISHSHWDREWYLPFQVTRIRLTGLLDRVLEILDTDPEYKYFMSDGHTALLEDYLAVRPDRRPLVERFVREGRLLVGPWYVAPDEWLPGGESLIRNLQLGMRQAQALGGVMGVGYLPDTFGQIIHLPSILRGFGINYAAFWRGADARLEKMEFLWEAPDGSTVLALHLALGYAFAKRLSAKPEELKDQLNLFRQMTAGLSATGCLAIMNGGDHAPAQRNLPAVLATARTLFPDSTIEHGNLPLLFQTMEKVVREKGIALPRFQGEMRSGQRGPILTNAISARMWIKQRNQACETLLTAYVEPFSAWVGLLRARLGDAWQEPLLPWGPQSDYPRQSATMARLAREAWRKLLLNHAHDSIYGCGVDEVHRETAARFDACEQIGEDLAERALASVAAQAGEAAPPRAVVFNPLAASRTDFISFPWPVRDDGQVPLAVESPNGESHACQIIAESAAPPSGPVSLLPRTLDVGFIADNVPGCGYKAFHVVHGPRPDAIAGDGGRSIENEFFAVTADPADGSISLREKATGRVLRGLNRFVDDGDRGDEYNYWTPEPDEVVDRPSSPPEIAIVESGPARSALAVSMTYSLPVGLSEDRETRSSERVACRIRSQVYLYPGVRRVDFRTEVDNQARDHRLRVHFPSDIQADVVHAEQHFGVVSRPIAIPEADENWAERPQGTQPQKAFVDVNDGERGLLLANRGLPEYEAIARAEGVTLALTLLRCVGWLSLWEMSNRKVIAGPPLETPEAQCLGRQVFEYAIAPHEGGWEKAFVEGHGFARPLRASLSWAEPGALPAATSLVEITSPEMVVSAVKFAEGGDGVVARLYNIADRAVEARVRLTAPCGRVERVNLNEEPLAELPLEDGWVQIVAKRNEIVSLLFPVRLWEGKALTSGGPQGR